MNTPSTHIEVAPKDISYAETITQFQVDMAMESEGLALDYQRTLKGVQSVLQDESKGRYVLSCTRSNCKRTVKEQSNKTP